MCIRRISKNNEIRKIALKFIAQSLKTHFLQTNRQIKIPNIFFPISYIINKPNKITLTT